MGIKCNDKINHKTTNKWECKDCLFNGEYIYFIVSINIKVYLFFCYQYAVLFFLTAAVSNPDKRGGGSGASKSSRHHFVSKNVCGNTFSLLRLSTSHKIQNKVLAQFSFFWGGEMTIPNTPLSYMRGPALITPGPPLSFIIYWICPWFISLVQGIPARSLILCHYPLINSCTIHYPQC